VVGEAVRAQRLEVLALGHVQQLEAVVHAGHLAHEAQRRDAAAAAAVEPREAVLPMSTRLNGLTRLTARWAWLCIAR
jgi:hypothetical protein